MTEDPACLCLRSCMLPLLLGLMGYETWGWHTHIKLLHSYSTYSHIHTFFKSWKKQIRWESSSSIFDLDLVRYVLIKHLCLTKRGVEWVCVCLFNWSVYVTHSTKTWAASHDVRQLISVQPLFQRRRRKLILDDSHSDQKRPIFKSVWLYPPTHLSFACAVSVVLKNKR